MYPEEQGIARPTKPGPIARAVSAAGIAAPAQLATRPVELDPFAYRGSYPGDAPKGPRNGPDSTALDPVPQGIAGGLPQPAVKVATAPIQQQGGIASGISTGIGNEGAAPALSRQVVGDHAPSPNAQAGIAAMPAGRSEQGIITAESAAAAMGGNMTRSGGIYGTYDGKGVNEILARENKARGEMIDSMIKANGGNGIATLPDHSQQQQQQVPSISDLQSAMKSAGTRTERAAYGQALNQAIAGQNQLAHEQMRQQGVMDQRGIAAGIEKERLAGIDHRAADRNQIQMRGQDLTASTAANRIAGQERIVQQRTQDAGTRLTLPQRRSNFEIDAARERVAGLSPEEIKRKTDNYTATGRENPDFDPTLAKAVSLANRRKYGDDADFDQRQQAQQPEGDNGDVATRFKADQAMRGHTLGKQTDSGVEVFDASGKLVGHYR